MRRPSRSKSRRHPLRPPSLPSHRWPRPRKENGHWAYWFFDAVYRENVHLIWPVTDQQRRTYIRRHFGIEDTPADPRGRVSEILPDKNGKGGWCQVVALAYDWRMNSGGIALLAHECFHVVENVFSRRGVRFCNSPDESNEHAAYFLESVVKRCAAAIEIARK